MTECAAFIYVAAILDFKLEFSEVPPSFGLQGALLPGILESKFHHELCFCCFIQLKVLV